MLNRPDGPVLRAVKARARRPVAPRRHV